jgi:hypothetical protein
MMKRIAKKHDITPKKLHDYWVADYKMSPDDWIKEQLADKKDSIVEQALAEYGIRGVHRVQSTR